MKRLRHIFVNSPGSIGGDARKARARKLLETFPDLADMKVLDLGGTFNFWNSLLVRPKEVTAINVATTTQEHRGRVTSWFRIVSGDACQPPRDVMESNFDLVFSNSTIEHVGNHDRRRLFAEVVHRLAGRHWIQTPNRAFPIEPHVLFPFHQFFPRSGRAVVYRYWPLVHTRSPTWQAATRAVDATQLIGSSELAGLFPESRILEERWIPLLPPKSLVAIKS